MSTGNLSPSHDAVLRGATLIDGTGRPPYRADLPEPLNLLGDPSDFRFCDFRSYFDAVDAGGRAASQPGSGGER
ncbi:MAG: hypothetical protein OXQ89_08865 [Rhodospirillaceae bacterium]|nr:hypothetical protein [Rhodospirillaceae bacterium]